jgi:hypothetical protein
VVLSRIVVSSLVDGIMSLLERVQSVIKASHEGTDLLFWCLLFFATVSVCCPAVFFITLHFLKRQGGQGLQGIRGSRPAPWVSRRPIPLHVFGQPRRWMAFRTRNMGMVRNALGVNNAELCTWQQGLSHVGMRHLFIAPPIRGWILVFGHLLPNPTDDIDRFYAFMRDVSSEVGEVQFFCLDTALQEHAWVRLIDGNVVRSYVWAEEPLWNEGSESSAERSLRMQSFDYGFRVSDAFGTEWRDKVEHNITNLHALAARWSLDPLQVEAKDFASEFGLSGEVDPLRVG